MDKKSYDNGTDFSFVEQKVREVQTTIENAVKTSNYQELNQSITKMVNNTLKQYQKEHPATVQKKTESRSFANASFKVSSVSSISFLDERIVSP